MIKIENVILNSNSTTRKQLFLELANKGYELGIVKNVKELENGFWERERQGSTGMEFGFAIPHAQIDAISEPTIIVVKTKNPISNYKTFDKTKVTNIIALLIPTKNIQKEHINILSHIATKLSDEKFRNKINNAKNKQDIVKIINDNSNDDKQEIKNTSLKNSVKIVGITSCAAGVAHTYIAKDNLVKEGKAKGYDIKIETQGASGPESVLKAKEIKESDVIIIASDIDVDTSRFIGQKIYRTSVTNAVKNASKVIDNALQKSTILNEGNLNTIESSNANNKKSFLSHIMNGVSWMIPLLITTAILLAIPNIAGAIVGQSEIVSQGKWDAYVQIGLDSTFWKFMNMMMHIGWTSISLMFPIFAAFTAYSIGNKPAFIPGLIGGFLAKPSLLYGEFKNLFTPDQYPYLNTSSGFWGALLIGIIMGYIIKYAAKYIKVHKIIAAIKPMLILPFIGGILSLTLMILVINPAFGLLNEELIKLAKNSGNSGKYILALVIAPMIAADLGGPINKAAYTAMLTFYETRTISLTMRVIPTITPSIGLGLAAIFDKFIVRKRVFDDDVRLAAPNSIILACLGISEGGLPFVFKRPLLTIPINMLGGIVGAYIGIFTGTKQWFPDAAIWAWPFAKPVWGLLVGILGGSLFTMFMHISLRLILMKIGILNIDAKYNILRKKTKIIKNAKK